MSHGKVSPAVLSELNDLIILWAFISYMKSYEGRLPFLLHCECMAEQADKHMPICFMLDVASWHALGMAMHHSTLPGVFRRGNQM